MPGENSLDAVRRARGEIDAATAALERVGNILRDGGLPETAETVEVGLAGLIAGARHIAGPSGILAAIAGSGGDG